jgi:hypothetical protein
VGSHGSSTHHSKTGLSAGHYSSCIPGQNPSPVKQGFWPATVKLISSLADFSFKNWKMIEFFLKFPAFSFREMQAFSRYRNSSFFLTYFLINLESMFYQLSGIYENLQVSRITELFNFFRNIPSFFQDFSRKMLS